MELHKKERRLLTVLYGVFNDPKKTGEKKLEASLFRKIRMFELTG
jgi:hypothetical protein